MTRESIAPWSELEDECAEAQEAAASSGVGLRPEGEDGVSPSAVRPGGRPGLRGRVAPQWALVPLGVAAIWLLVCVAVFAGAEGGIPTQHAVAVLLLVAGAGVLVVSARHSRLTALERLHQAINAEGAWSQDGFDDESVGKELQPLWRMIRQHMSNIDKRGGDLLEEQSRLSLELSLAETQKRQAEAIIFSISDPVLVTDAFDQLMFANPAAEGAFGFSLSDVLRQPVAEVIPDEGLVAAIHHAREACNRAASRRAEHEIGSRAYAVAMSALVRESGTEDASESHGVVVVMRDITKEREATRMKSEFVARAAHELRTPLSSIRAYVEMLVDGEFEDEKTREEYHNIIQTSADRLGRMIDNMLNISRIEAGTVRINKEPVAISMVVKEAVDGVRPQAEEKGLTLTEELTPVAFRIMADRDMFYQAVLNLLSNAIKYTPEGGSVHVRITPHEENRTIAVEVSDTGVGIPKEDFPKMCQKFFRVEANKKMAKGTGLGLNLVKHIVETIHGGKMILKSEVGKGSTFGIVFPLMS